jgi:hypothetical protein
MTIKFVSMIYYRDRIICMTEEGDLYEYNPQGECWSLLIFGPKKPV